jgi:transposase
MTMPSMPQLVSDDQDDSTADEVILGVDTHHDGHVAAVITALGVLVDTAKFPTTAAGYQALVGWVATFGVLRRAGVEGTGSYGAALARHLRAAGVEVIEVNAPDKATRRRQGKTDTLDAEAAARAVLSGRASGSAKAGDGPVEMLRGVEVGQGLRYQGPHPGHQPTRKPCSWRPIQPCARRCRA